MGTIDLKAGQIITFGNYFKNSGGKKEPLEWRILETDGCTALLITDDAIDCKQYHHEYTAVSWNDCDLRKWCNNVFLMEAFSETERKAVVTARNQNDYGPETDDHIFCLSTEEAEKYFHNCCDRACRVTLFALSLGAVDLQLGNTSWWLRTHGGRNNYAAYVCGDGCICDNGYYVYYHRAAVRPACRINLASYMLLNDQKNL